MPQFRDLAIGEQFTFIGVTGTFFGTCTKTSTFLYRDGLGFGRRIGTILATVTPYVKPVERTPYTMLAEYEARM